jgi:hemolysin activation/secretion protein
MSSERRSMSVLENEPRFGAWRSEGRAVPAGVLALAGIVLPGPAWPDAAGVPPAPFAAPVPGVKPEQAHPVPAPAGAPAGATAPASAPERNPAFDIWAFRIDGNTVLGDEATERAVYPFAGPGKTLDDVQKARQALEKAYHDAGYTTVLVDIPEQSVEEGLVVLSVTEGKVGRLRVVGSQYHSIARIKAEVPALAEGQVPHMPTVQKQLAGVATASPDRTVTPVLKAGNAPGKLDVDLNVDDRLPLHGSLEMNSRGTANTSYSRLIAGIRYDNLWQKQHSASIQFQTAPQDVNQLQTWSGTYALPTDFYDTRLAFYGVGIESNTPIAAGSGTSVAGPGLIFGARALTPFHNQGGWTQTATFGFDYKDFGASGVSPAIHYAPFVIGYSLVHHGERSLSSLDARVNFSVRGLGNDPAQFPARRYGAQANYLYFAGEAKHEQILPYDLLLSVRAGGQVADTPLIQYEQMSGGGVGNVRGYHVAEALGDEGVNGSFELQSPQLGQSEYVQNLRLLAFIDAAQLWELEPLPETPTHYSLAGAGAGFRFQALHNFLTELDWSYPLLSVGRVKAGDQRIDFRVAYEF